MVKALSVRQPWAWLIVHGHKDIENRSWRTSYRGPLLIHAPQKFDDAGYVWVRRNFPEIDIPAKSELVRGAVVGAVMLVSIKDHRESPWFTGPLGWRLEQATVFDEPRPCPGRLGLWDADMERDATR